MLDAIQRGSFTPPEILTGYLEQMAIPPKKWKNLERISQLRYLKREPHDILVDTLPQRRTSLLVFFRHQDTYTTVMIPTFQKLDLGPGISPSVFDGTVLEVKFVQNTFQVYDVYYWKGTRVTSRIEAFKKLQEEVLPFMSIPTLYTYDDICTLTDKRLLFLPRATTSRDPEVWIFNPNTL